MVACATYIWTCTHQWFSTGDGFAVPVTWQVSSINTCWMNEWMNEPTNPNVCLLMVGRCFHLQKWHRADGRINQRLEQYWGAGELRRHSVGVQSRGRWGGDRFMVHWQSWQAMLWRGEWETGNQDQALLCWVRWETALGWLMKTLSTQDSGARKGYQPHWCYKRL